MVCVNPCCVCEHCFVGEVPAAKLAIGECRYSNESQSSPPRGVAFTTVIEPAFVVKCCTMARPVHCGCCAMEDIVTT
jgi:hypothetical protein